jgi:FkbM family methyltransferase
MKLAIIDTLGLTYDGSTLSKRGLGGSESAVICIARELVKLGIEVDVYNSCIDSEATPGVYDGVKYIDHTQIDNAVKYDIVISSRSVYPFFANSHHQFANSAKHKILWMHDTFCEGDEHIEPMLQGGFINEVFTLSDFHTNYVTNNNHGSRKRMYEIIKDKFWQTRNGANTWIDEVDVTQKDRNHFVYNASVTKGLLPLLEFVWPEVKKRIPAAHLTVIGGYYRFREGAQPDAQEQQLNKLIDDPKFETLDVKFTRVIPQFEIAEILSNAGFMIYPTAFPETFGISTLESLLYRTPVITNTFGALEETAVNLACYKVPYPTEPNSLFPHIDKQKQVQQFVEQVVRAHSDTYLWQQKQYYCDVVKDIAGWDTVALQWKQHLYNITGNFLSVDEYRAARRINDKVSRIFGRRINNKEQNVYTSYGKQNRFVIVSPFWNAENYIEKCIKSVASQDYENYHHILIDDLSDDNGWNRAKDLIETFPEEIKEKFTLIKNPKNRGAIKNQLSAIKDYAADDDIIMLLDGDDWLVNNNSIFHYYNDIYNRGYEFTYGSMWSIADNIPLIAQDYPKNVKNTRSYRNCKFTWNLPYTHFRTFKAQLLNNINDNVFKDSNNEWMRAGADVPLFYNLIEAADPAKVYCNKEIVYNYNDANPLNDYKVRADEQNSNAKLSMSSNKLENKPEAKKLKVKNKKILIAIPTNKYIEPETFRAIYNLDVPEGYDTEFQFFYGYQIDQIRNLIAEWAKHYDYLLSVDSDIVLPKDALKKMLAADKDVISGLYIQRIPGTQVVEIYQDNPTGGVNNIPYRVLENQGTVQVAACGFGAVLVKGEVFRKMAYPHFMYKSAIKHSDTISEDVYFCKKAREAGFTVWADTSIKCEHIGQQVFSLETFEEKSLRHIANQDLLPNTHKEYLKSMNISPSVVYDIGACVMHWTKEAEKIWPTAEYYMFDAVDELDFLYKETNHMYHFGPLTDQDNKPLKFYKDVTNAGGNSYYKENSVHYNETHAVPLTGMTLDTVVKNNNWPLPDLIKIDVQGAEIDVLKGAANTLAKCKDIILEAQHTNYNEGAPKADEVIEFMKSIGFKLVSSFSKNANDADYHFTKD